MSRLGLKTQMLSRYRSAWLMASPAVTPMGTMMAVPFSHCVRHVSTTRPKKAQAMKETLKETAAAVPTTNVSKANGPIKTRKSPTKATATAAAAENDAKTTTQAKKTEAAKAKAVKVKTTSSAAAEPKPRGAARAPAVAKSTPAPAPPKPLANTAMPPTKAKTPEPVITSVSATKKQSAPAESGRFAPPRQYSAPKPTSSDVAGPSTPSSAPDNSRSKVNTSSPEYKRAAWKWTSTMVALPILLVTSYILFDRLALGNDPGLEKIRASVRGLTASGEAEAVAPGGGEGQTTSTA